MYLSEFFYFCLPWDAFSCLDKKENQKIYYLFWAGQIAPLSHFSHMWPIRIPQLDSNNPVIAMMDTSNSMVCKTSMAGEVFLFPVWGYTDEVSAYNV